MVGKPERMAHMWDLEVVHHVNLGTSKQRRLSHRFMSANSSLNHWPDISVISRDRWDLLELLFHVVVREICQPMPYYPIIKHIHCRAYL